MSGGAAGNQQGVGSQGRPQLGGMGQQQTQAMPGVLNPGQFTKYNANPLSSQPVSSYVSGMPTLRQDPQVAELIRQGNMQGARDLQDSLAIQNGKDIVPRPLGGMPAQGMGQRMSQVMGQQLLGGFPGRPNDAPDLSRSAYNQFLSLASFSGQPPTYEQWVQQRQAPIPAVMPQKPGVGPMPRPQVFPRPPIGAPNPSMTNVLPVRPPAQVNPGKPQMPSGLAGLANAIRGRQ